MWNQNEFETPDLDHYPCFPTHVKPCTCLSIFPFFHHYSSRVKVWKGRRCFFWGGGLKSISWVAENCLVLSRLLCSVMVSSGWYRLPSLCCQTICLLWQEYVHFHSQKRVLCLQGVQSVSQSVRRSELKDLETKIVQLSRLNCFR